MRVLAFENEVARENFPMKSYHPDIYHINHDNSCRYTLGISGKQPLVAVGLNPSTADDLKPDQTISRVMGFARRNGFDGFIMLNLYPLRTPYPQKLPNSLDRNALHENINQWKQICDHFQPKQILAAWGSIIEIRPYFKACLYTFAEYADENEVEWMRIGEFTKSGHPRHPSRAAYKQGLQTFALPPYLKSLST